jgi:putative FmdB family regulatory protein
MPIFEYVCKQCNRSFEALVMGSKKATCPECGGTDLEDKFSTYAVRSTGGGWRGQQFSGGGCGAGAGGG